MGSASISRRATSTPRSGSRSAWRASISGPPRAGVAGRIRWRRVLILPVSTSMRRLLFLAPVLAALAAVPSAAIAAPRPVALTAEQQSELQKITDFLNGIRTMTARFTQYSENGGVAEGQLYVERPGRMRFEYDPPTPILLVADGNFVIYFDKSL